jgi:acyl carrier protein
MPPDCLQRINEIFRYLFDDEDLVVTRETSANDLEQWDSLMHVSLIIKVESAFGVRFSSTEVAKLQNVGDLLDLIEAKQRK